MYPPSGVRCTLRAEWNVPSERSGMYPPSGVRCALRAERATLSEQGERHPSSEATNTLRAGRVTRFGQGERHASSGADSKTWFYRYSFVFCPLQVFLAGKLDEKALGVSLRVRRAS